MSRRIVIVGGPRTGKTTLALTMQAEHDIPALHTDELIPTHAWSDASEAVSRWLDRPGPWVIEGVAAVRALRKWLERNPTGAPCDEVISLWVPRVRLEQGQASMLKACHTVWQEIRSALLARGVVLR